MTSLRRVRRKQCQGKVRHPNPQAAYAHAASLKHKGDVTGFINAYKCRFCGGWHVGHFRSGERY